MLKQEALKLLGGTASAAARAIGVTPQAVNDWPDALPPRIADRVQAALWRQSQSEPQPKPKRRRKQPVAA